ncbi:uncharacterized protein LOC112572755 isoform X2 [Pomacea canaliculata]|uniref:uncharacterized protein LOC112572755 isoform X2 n=1 Tax=Pomacea canaliculata TaxID=400727 RepID=UPI000D72889E|nr:uncharacterized protein LOC112572755 isoform X2 [Pomacea canaliculata]
MDDKRGLCIMVNCLLASSEPADPVIMRVLLILLVGLLVVGEGTCFLNDLYKERSMPSERFLSTGDRKARAIASLFTPGRALPTGDRKAPVTVLLSALRKDGGRRWGPIPVN